MLTRGEFVATRGMILSLLLGKNWCQSRPHMRFIVTTALNPQKSRGKPQSSRRALNTLKNVEDVNSNLIAY